MDENATQKKQSQGSVFLSLHFFDAYLFD